MIELHNISKSYRLANGERRYIFRDLDFSFPDGANIGLIGRNGAGKSTLLRIIGGIDTPDRGRVVTDKRISWPVGLSGMQGSLTARDIVKFVCRVYGTTHEEMLEKVRYVEAFAEIGEYFDQPIKTYSSGMRAKVNFGTSLAFDFDYYLMDEVGAVGDAAFKEKSRRVLQERIARSRVIMVSHSMSAIARECDVVVLLEDGEAVLYEDVQEGIKAYEAVAGADAPRNMARKKRRGLAGLSAEAREMLRQQPKEERAQARLLLRQQRQQGRKQENESAE
jgi:capsular polysaccharide transport system ATP-binding protein